MDFLLISCSGNIHYDGVEICIMLVLNVMRRMRMDKWKLLKKLQQMQTTEVEMKAMIEYFTLPFLVSFFPTVICLWFLNLSFVMEMDWVQMGVVLLVTINIINVGKADTMVSGTVFCDQCKDGQISLLDYPLGGVRVLMACPGELGDFTLLREETTNWLGTFTTTFAGTLDMSSCRAQVSANGQGCGATAGPAQDFRLRFRMFDTETYTVDPLIAQPAQPSPFCPRPESLPPPLLPPPVNIRFQPRPPPPPSLLPPPVNYFQPRPPPPPPLLPPPVPLPPPPQTPPLIQFPPPLPSLPPLPALPPLPPFPSLPPKPSKPAFEASACPHQMWMMAQHRCYWSVLSPDLKVADVFGPLASTRYGTNITLHEGMFGRGDPYRTLLREGTTALLNSYSSIQFPYQPTDVVEHVNSALRSESIQEILSTGFHFIMANSGQTGNVTCKFTTCA
ncbi:hypothetical protein OSB04_005754 [Centaurea solstitialis]|uniref:Uncharacterized protein n=1 Tax=Centaurea solstitialis TaxID=347529 RepID=A0AA38TGN6_9ASTR|nr:hypothetical protein OSB04_005754 [Centaurea solstitialis]